MWILRYNYRRKSWCLQKPGNKIPNKDLRINSKNLLYIIECNKCKGVYIGPTQAVNTRILLQKSNFRILENGKINESKHLYECSHG